MTAPVPPLKGIDNMPYYPTSAVMGASYLYVQLLAESLDNFVLRLLERGVINSAGNEDG
ncbi:MAG: hypothetical protein V3T23_06370 [Nitrososphaerales archaeon]